MPDPAVRAFQNGVIFLDSVMGLVQEPLVVRPLGVVPCPYVQHDPAGGWFAREYGLTDGTTSWAFWRAWAWPAPGAADVRVGVLGDAMLGLLTAWGSANQRLDIAYNAPWLACDINLDGAANVLDFVCFTNRPFDFNGDGVVDDNDHTAVQATCGGGG